MAIDTIKRKLSIYTLLFSAGCIIDGIMVGHSIAQIASRLVIVAGFAIGLYFYLRGEGQ